MIQAKVNEMVLGSDFPQATAFGTLDALVEAGWSREDVATRCVWRARDFIWDEAWQIAGWNRPEDENDPAYAKWEKRWDREVEPAIDRVLITMIIQVLSGTVKRIGPEIRRLVFERDAYRCVDCDGWHNLTVDHVIPQSKGGSHAMGNLVTRCQSCNSKKGTAL